MLNHVIKIGLRTCIRTLACVVPAVCTAQTPTLSTYGTSGLVENPTALPQPEGTLSYSLNTFGPNLRHALSFQVLPQVSGTFRYGRVDDLYGDGPFWDRSFDAQIQLLDETDRQPAVAIGFRDFLGTGLLNSEYIVATKHVSSNVALTGGLGWGRLAGRSVADSPFAFISPEFGARSSRDDRREIGGQIEAGVWFRGPVGFFGGIDWDVTDTLSVQLEYSPDIYTEEVGRTSFSVTSPFNAAVQYQFANGATLKAFVIGGENIGGQLSFALNASERLIPAGREPAPRPIVPRDGLASASWNSSGANVLENRLRRRLGSEGISLDAFRSEGAEATIHVQNNRWDIESQAIGRAARVLANTLPPEFETFHIIIQRVGLPITKFTLARSDLEGTQFAFDAAGQMLARITLEDAPGMGQSTRKFRYRISPYAAFALFDPDEPARIDVGPQLDLNYYAAPGLTFAGRFRYPLFGNMDQANRPSDSILPRVRSEAYRFARESEFEVSKLTARYLWRPSPDMFARVTAGYLESQFGGISGEVLWFPVESRLALGAELNYARQRDFDMLIGFQDYDVVTGHASAYYDFNNGFHGQLDVGRYLAGDWGATFQLHREFGNGVRVGGFFTLTDVSFEDYGEGAFDKGLTIEFPLSYFTGTPSRRTLGQVIRPILRDGGARLALDNRLYSVVRDYRRPNIARGWGRFAR